MTGRGSPPPTLEFESALWQAGAGALAGLDEAGCGAWAGPVAAAAVILPPEPAMMVILAGVRDSKQMTPLQRMLRAEQIRKAALAWAVGLATNAEIDLMGILPATRLAMERALAGLGVPAGHLLIDAVHLPEVETPQTILIKGDQRSLSIAAASVLAKTARDGLMIGMEGDYPGYGFAQHKGYGTRLHREALQRMGACAQHRFSFAPVKRNLCGTLEGQV